MLDSFEEVFKHVVDYCRDKGDIGETALDLWIGKIVPVELAGNKAILSLDSEFQRGIVMSNYSGLLKEGFKEILGFDVEIDIIVPQAEETTATEEEKIIENIIENHEEKQQELEQKFEYAKYDYTFDTFIVGSSNNIAYAACTAVAKSGGIHGEGNTDDGRIYNPLFIHGPSGLGKTHLMTATAKEMKKNNSSLKIIYVTGETFASEIINAIQTKSTAKFHDKYRHADVLLVDDIQFIAGKDSTQEEFFHTFNALYQDKKQIVLTSDRPPKAIKTLEDRIRSRFESGLIVDISTPDFETRMAIIKRKAELLDLKIPDDVSEFIANKIKTNIRQLEGAVKKLKALNHFAGGQPTISMAQSVIRDILNDDQPLPVTIDKIISEVANIYGVSADDMRSNKRSSVVSAARKIAIFIVRAVTGMSLTDIGKEFGNRDHSTIVYAIKNVEDNIQKDESLKGLIDDIMKNVQDFSRT